MRGIMEGKEILERIGQSDMVLVGLGEEFDDTKRLRENPLYQQGADMLRREGIRWLLPAWNAYCSSKLDTDVVAPALEKLAELLEGRNFYVVSVSTNDVVAEVLGRSGRLVSPCGGALVKQCGKGCGSELIPVAPEEKSALELVFAELYGGHFPANGFPGLGSCAQCGSPMVLNNVYAENYDEKGYLDQWSFYTKWLTGTLNRRLVLLELGVGMRFPSVVRWAFERIATYQDKAFLCRVDGKLYQLPEKFTSKGASISKNAIDWLREL